MTQRFTRANWICLLYGISGCAGLIYETVWIRQFALSFGNTLLSFSTVISVFLGGLALGASLAGRFRTNRPFLFYGAAEIWIALYALLIPWLMSLSPHLLAPLYGPAGEGVVPVAFARALLCSLIILPATIPMGAGLPWLLSALSVEKNAPKLIWIYAVNTAGGALGALLAGFVLLPSLGYWRTLIAASALDVAVGIAAILLSTVTITSPRTASEEPLRTLSLAAFLTGFAAMLYEVAASRIAGLLFGPTAATVTLTLAIVLLGLAAGSIIASLISKLPIEWFSRSQIAAALLLLTFSAAIAASPEWLADQIRANAGHTGFLEAELLFLLLFPLMTAAGMALPLAMSTLKDTQMGKLYGINTAGAILGALLTGWLLIPTLGTERTLYLGAILNAALAAILLRRYRWVSSAFAVIALALFIFPRWDMAALTSGSYKYAPYYSRSATEELHNGEMEFLREGSSGTVTVRRVANSQILAIDGKVDATDAGGDLLTEKLLAHLPLSLIQNPKDICVIGLASGVTAGAVLTYSPEHLDVLEVSREVAEASHFFDQVNGQPLSSNRVHLIVNDGRNHLALTTRQYDAIISEPSNPWISGMNSMFTRDFFRIARARLKPNGVLAQWFHLYNMPPDDLRSLLRAFTEVFPKATLWQLNQGDVLLTGSATEPILHAPPALALADLKTVAATPDLLASLFIMKGADLIRFAANAEPNTDDRPLLEFHGQRDLDLQTDETNMAELTAFAPSHNQQTPELTLARARMFEKAESDHLAFESYKKLLTESPGDATALAGAIRTARAPEEIAFAGTLQSRTNEALTDAQQGNTAAAESLFHALIEAFPDRPETHMNFGVFSLERNRLDDAIAAFSRAIKIDPRYLPAYEATAQAYMQKKDLQNAAQWSSRILQIDPNHESAKQALAALARQGITPKN